MVHDAENFPNLDTRGNRRDRFEYDPHGLTRAERNLHALADSHIQGGWHKISQGLTERGKHCDADKRTGRLSFLLSRHARILFRSQLIG